jgi:hypothetical protein
MNFRGGEFSTGETGNFQSALTQGTLVRLRHVFVLVSGRMSALIFTGSLWAVLPGRTAIASKPGGQCAVCESCKAILCNDLT